VAAVAQRLDGLREQDRLADGRGLGREALLLGLVPEGGEIGRDRNAGDDLHIALLEGVDLGEKSSVRFW
jgi:hypothetical protein